MITATVLCGATALMTAALVAAVIRLTEWLENRRDMRAVKGRAGHA